MTIKLDVVLFKQRIPVADAEMASIDRASARDGYDLTLETGGLDAVIVERKGVVFEVPRSNVLCYRRLPDE